MVRTAKYALVPLSHQGPHLSPTVCQAFYAQHNSTAHRVPIM